MNIPKARKLSSGRYFIYLRIKGEQISVIGDTEAECQAKAMAIKAGIAKKQKDYAGTIGNMIDRYIDARTNVLSPSTLRGYNTIRRNRFQNIMDRKPQGINWQREVNAEARDCSPKTLKNAWGLIYSALKENGIEPTVTLPAVSKTPMPWLSPEQIPIFLSAIEGRKCELPALLGLCSLRRSEIFGLQWQNVDLEKDVLHVRETVVKGEDGFVQKPTAKTEKSARAVPIIIPRLHELLEGVEDRSGYVCQGNPGSPYKQINAVCRANDLPEIGMHGLRRSFASLGYHLGLSEMEIMAIGGWSDFQTVHKFYLYLSETDRLKGVEKLSGFFEDCKPRSQTDPATH